MGEESHACHKFNNDYNSIMHEEAYFLRQTYLQNGDDFNLCSKTEISDLCPRLPFFACRVLEERK